MCSTVQARLLKPWLASAHLPSPLLSLTAVGQGNCTHSL